VYFPRSGNGGYQVTGYDIQFRYESATDRLHGQTTITAQATEDLSALKLDLRLPASAVTVDDRPAAIHQDGGKLQVTPAVAVRAGAPMTVRVDYSGVPSAIPNRHCGASPWLRTADGAVAVGEPDIAPWWYPCNDHPLDKATFAITAVVPTALQVISNGAPLGGGTGRAGLAAVALAAQRADGHLPGLRRDRSLRHPAPRHSLRPVPSRLRPDVLPAGRRRRPSLGRADTANHRVPV
jgi:aminopeptidase N